MMEKLGSPRSLVYQQGTLKWNTVKNAIGYIVYDGEQILGTTTDTSFPVSEVNYALKAVSYTHLDVYKRQTVK